MLILALETATDAGSVALYNNGEMLTADCPRGEGAAGQHSATLLPQVTRLLKEANIQFSDLDAIAFGHGPGAFTGLRMGCALAQGLAVAHDQSVIEVGSLEAMAWLAASTNFEVGESPFEITALLDARMGEVYLARVKVSAKGVLLAEDITLGRPDTLVLPQHSDLYCGNALSAYPVLLDKVNALGKPILPDLVPHAIAVAQLARLAWLGGERKDAADVGPRYIRDKVAKTIVERLAEGGRA